MPDYGVFVTFERDPYGWGSEFPLGRYACSFRQTCVEWSRGCSVLQNVDKCGWPVEVHMWRYRDDGGDDAVVRLSFRDVRSAARGILDEETLFETQGVDPDTFMKILEDNESARREAAAAKRK